MFYILEGEATITINKVDYLAKPRDAFICALGDVHNLYNKTDAEFRLVISKINLPEDREDSYWHSDLTSQMTVWVSITFIPKNNDVFPYL